MASPVGIPDRLRTGPFLRSDAAGAGLSPQALRGQRFIRLHRGVYVCADVTRDLRLALCAARLVLPTDAAVASLTALRLFGAGVGPALPLHFATQHRQHTRLPGIVCHRHTHFPQVRSRNGLPVCRPEQAWVRGGLLLGFVDRVTAAEWLLHRQHITLASLHHHVAGSREHGVKRARRTLAYVRARVESPRETRRRLMLVFARLPEPEPNVVLGDEWDVWVRVDLVYRGYRAIVEYDGEQHRLDRRQHE